MKLPPSDFSAAFRRALLSWYSRHKRALPWRRTRDPYAILVSEIMLQQTQVRTALPYYGRFLKLFPTAPSLAQAPLRRVLAAWAGLGYYRRARHLHEAVKQIRRLGAFPRGIEGLRALKGVGPYTAAALGSIAFGLPYAVVDGNVIRVLARVLGLKTIADSGPGLQKIQAAAQELLDPKRPGDFNQALMELGALVCVPGIPTCRTCPTRQTCRAFKLGLTEKLPILKKRPKTVLVHKAVAVIADQAGRMLMGPRQEGERMQGFWKFPEAVVKTAAVAPGAAKELAEGLLGKGRVRFLKTLPAFTHSILHFRITVYPYVFEAPTLSQSGGWERVGRKQAERLPLAAAEKRILKQVGTR